MRKTKIHIKRIGCELSARTRPFLVRCINQYHKTLGALKLQGFFAFTDKKRILLSHAFCAPGFRSPKMLVVNSAEVALSSSQNPGVLNRLNIAHIGDHGQSIQDMQGSKSVGQKVDRFKVPDKDGIVSI